MHLGNIRTALMNYLFAHQKQGTFVLRIEDTDAQRNYDPNATQIIADLTWLGLTFDEGPEKHAGNEPYFQSQRDHIYKENLEELIQLGGIYRCFCTLEELDKKRERQQALRQPPRYDRTCLQLSESHITENLAQGIPFVWRVKLDHNRTITIHDLARGPIHFELKNISDFPITRQDGSFTFMFANFVDDRLMKITHVFRGEDHLTNTAGQTVLYQITNTPLPIFWHMPMICNVDGKKLSKRDFGFSLRDLKDAGFLPQAITNYLAIIGGSFEQEIMDLETLVKTIPFENLHAAGQIKYDVEKLTWLNHKWIAGLAPLSLAAACRPHLETTFSAVKNLTDAQLSALLVPVQSDLTTLNDSASALQFCFQSHSLSAGDLHACITEKYRAQIAAITKEHISLLPSPTSFVDAIKASAAQQQIPIKEFFWFLRLALMNSTKGPAIHLLVEMLGTAQATERINNAVAILE